MTVYVTEFSGEFDWLSNFYECPVQRGAIIYKTAEHAYQAAKHVNPADHDKIAKARWPNIAKRIGRSIQCRSDWEDIKVDVMRSVLAAKFSDIDLRQKLLDTGDAQLIEGNWWGDHFWGVCRGKGHNMLGKLLMELRDKLRADTYSSNQPTEEVKDGTPEAQSNQA